MNTIRIPKNRPQVIGANTGSNSNDAGDDTSGPNRAVLIVPATIIVPFWAILKQVYSRYKPDF